MEYPQVRIILISITERQEREETLTRQSNIQGEQRVEEKSKLVKLVKLPI